jgi:hypothetical protein
MTVTSGSENPLGRVRCDGCGHEWDDVTFMEYWQSNRYCQPRQKRRNLRWSPRCPPLGGEFVWVETLK